jgi:hypothetical protein
MQRLLVSFARTGIPTTGAVAVPRYDPGNEARLLLGDTIHVEHVSSAPLDFLQAHPVPMGFGCPPSARTEAPASAAPEAREGPRRD